MDRDKRKSKKDYLKNLPVWEEVEDVKLRSQRLDKSLDKLIGEQEETLSELDGLPKLNPDKTLKVTEVDLADDPANEIVRVYVKSETGVYQLQDDKSTRVIVKGRQDSIQKLGSKIVQGQEVFAMLKPRKPWVRCHVDVVYQKRNQPGSTGYSSVFYLKIVETKKIIHVNKYSVALAQEHDNCLEPPKRVIAGETEYSMYPGTIVFEPSAHNRSRYLVMMDDGQAKYFNSCQIFPIVGQSMYPWQDARLYINTGSNYNEFYLKDYLLRFPKRDLLRLTKTDYGRVIQLYNDGRLRNATIIDDDCDIMRVKYEDETIETIYKGSLRLRRQDHSRLISGDGPDLLVDEKIQTKFHYQLPINILTYHDSGCAATYEDIYKVSEDFGDIIVSEKSDSYDNSPKKYKVKVDDVDDIDIVELDDDDTNSDSSNSRNSHPNGVKCKHSCLLTKEGRNESTVKDLKAEFRNVSDLKVPLLLGWKHEIKECRVKNDNRKRSCVVYESPCGRIFKQLYYIKQYLIKTNSILDIDYFTDEPDIDLHSKRPDMVAFWEDQNIARDYETGEPLENKNIMAINQFNEERLPFDFKYAAKAFLHSRLVNNGLTLNEEFKSGCDCEDDCMKNIYCACHRLTMQVYGEVNSQKQLPQYKYKRLPHVIRTGIYECNSLCKCSSRCPNRVVGNGIRFRFQVSKTENKGWGLVCLDDIPKGSFICSYSAEILDDADRYGNDDMYFADMDYIDINERTKLRNLYDEDDEGVESDEDTSSSIHGIQNSKHEGSSQASVSTQESSSDISSKNKKQLADDQLIDLTIEDTNDGDQVKDRKDSSEIASNGKRQTNDHGPKREYRMKKRMTRDDTIDSSVKNKKSNDRPKSETGESKKRSKSKKRTPRYRGIHDMLGTHSFTLDARVSGNIGRFCNHSCEPNAFVQNVLLDTHDPRFHVPALFSNRTIKAMEEITWDYAYTIGSIPGRELICNCGSRYCKGRIL